MAKDTVSRSMRIKDLAHYAHTRAFLESQQSVRKALVWLNIEQALETQTNDDEVIVIQVPKGITKHGKTKEKEEVDD